MEYLTIIRIVVEKRVFVVLQEAVEDDSSALIVLDDMIRICESVDMGLVEVVETVEAQGQSDWHRRQSQLAARGVLQSKKVLKRRKSAQQPQVVTFSGNNIPTWSNFKGYRSLHPTATVQCFTQDLEDSSSSKVSNRSGSGSQKRPTNRHPRLQKRQPKIVVTEKSPDSGCLRPLLRETGELLSSTLHATTSAPVKIFEAVAEKLNSGYDRAKHAMESRPSHRPTCYSPARIYVPRSPSPPAYVPAYVYTRPAPSSNSTYIQRSVSPDRTPVAETTPAPTAGNSGGQASNSAGWELALGAAPTVIGGLLGGPAGAALGALFTVLVVGSADERGKGAGRRREEQAKLYSRWR